MARPKSDIAPRILHAARARFLLEGVDGASLRAIAADAGTSIGMVYYYYPTKDELFLAVVEEIYAGLLHELEVSLAAGGATEDKLQRLYARIAAMSDDEFTVIRLVVREALISSARLSRLMDRFAKGHLPLVLQMLLGGVAAGELSNQHHPAVLAAATVSLALLPQVFRRLTEGRLPNGVTIPPADALAASMVDVLFHGIGGQTHERSAHPRPAKEDKARKKPR